MADLSDSTTIRVPTSDVENRETPRLDGSAAPSRTQVGTTVAEGPLLDPASCPARLGKYVVLERIGYGGMGVVFKAVDPDLNRVVALKTIRSGILANEGEVQRFYNEARAIAHFRHPNIVQIFEIDRDAGHHYFTMEFAAGGAMSRRHAEIRSRGPKASAELMEKIARAVHFAHERKLVHRDLKPGNILLDDKGEPLVSDFGLVKFIEQDSDLTDSGQALGTLPYMSPEQVTGDKNQAGPGTDIWAIGVMLFELLAGQRPFSGRSKQETSNAIRKGALPSLRKIDPSLDRDLETIVSRCLEKHPRERYASALELAEDLLAWREGRSIKARPWPVHVRAWRWLRRRPVASALLGLMLVTAAMMAALLLLRDPHAWEKQIRRNLAQGQPVTLVSDTGGTAGSRWQVKGALTTLSAVQGQPLGINAKDLGVLELLADPGIPSYRLEAEILHQTDRLGHFVALYLCHEKHALVTGDVHFLLKLQFNDAEDDPVRFAEQAAKAGRPPNPGNPLEMHAVLIFDTESARNIPLQPTHFFRHEGKPKWRHLSVEATTAGLQVMFDGVQVGKWRWQQLQKKCDECMARIRDSLGPRVGGIAPRLSASGGLGLYAQNSSALFRNVRIVPIPDEE